MYVLDLRGGRCQAGLGGGTSAGRYNAVKMKEEVDQGVHTERLGEKQANRGEDLNAQNIGMIISS